MTLLFSFSLIKFHVYTPNTFLTVHQLVDIRVDSSSILNKNGESKHLYLVPDFSGNADFPHLILWWMQACHIQTLSC